jgi:N-acetylglutamate synthase-like GNAT family acetyltransferase
MQNNSSELQIRKANTNDSTTITQLSDQLGYATNEKDIEQRLNTILNHNENNVLVATMNELVVGWIHGFFTMRVESAFFVEIGGLVVHNDFRKMGIGKKLVEQVLIWAKQIDCKKVRVRCNIIRKESHVFYENIGFQLNKEQKIFDKKI